MTQAIDTKAKIVHRANVLMTQRGPNGFSYRDISEPLGVKNAAIHYHFPSKTDLILAVIEENHQVLRDSTAQFMAYGGSASEQIEGLFCFTLDRCKKGQPVCVVGALAADYDSHAEEVQRANRRFMTDTSKWVTRVLELGREQGEFEFAGSPVEKATVILAALQGGRQMYRIMGEEYLQSLFTQIRRELGIKV